MASTGEIVKRRLLMVIVGGLGVLLLSGYFFGLRDVERNAAAAAAARASQAAGALAPLIPDLSGKPVDLSSVMGRAQAHANAWQPEAALLGIEVSLLARGGIPTDAGGVAKLTFGPSPLRRASAPGTLVVVYDKAGLSSTTTRDKPGKALPEPMCGPEEVYRRAVGAGSSLISLHYRLDVHGQAAWHASDPKTPDVKPQVFDRQTCAPRANSKSSGR